MDDRFPEEIKDLVVGFGLDFYLPSSAYNFVIAKENNKTWY